MGEDYRQPDVSTGRRSSGGQVHGGKPKAASRRIAPAPPEDGEPGTPPHGRRFVVTVLGKSGSGKTVFLASLYSQLAEGISGFSAAGDDATDRRLGGYLSDLYLESEAPEGTTENEIKYSFSLRFGGESIADIDLFDYRGGATDEAADSDAGRDLANRIAASDIVIWMIDLSEVDKADISTRRARLLTNLRRLHAISSHAITTTPKLRVWSFVRTKVDVNYPALSDADLDNATDELKAHLGDVVGVSTYQNESFGNLVCIAPIGRATTDDAGRLVPGDEAVNVQWPLLASVRVLFQKRLEELESELRHAQTPKKAKASFWTQPSIDESQIETATDVQHELQLLARAMDQIDAEVPSCVQVLSAPEATTR